MIIFTTIQQLTLQSQVYRKENGWLVYWTVLKTSYLRPSKLNALIFWMASFRLKEDSKLEQWQNKELMLINRYFLIFWPTFHNDNPETQEMSVFFAGELFLGNQLIQRVSLFHHCEKGMQIEDAQRKILGSNRNYKGTQDFVDRPHHLVQLPMWAEKENGNFPGLFLPLIIL